MRLRDITFDFWLNVGILRLNTAIWRETWNEDSRDFVCLFLEVWGKQLFRLRLYETGLSRAARLAK